MRLLLIGFGNVGRQLARFLLDRVCHPGLASLPAQVVGIVTRSHGSLADPGGVDLARALGQVTGTGGFDRADPAWSDLDAATATATLDYDVLVELSVLSIAKRGEPALSLVRTALERGRHVVTANKGPVAFGYRELSSLARQRDRAFRFESTVMDGAPVFAMARASLRGCRVEAVSGILNATTNFVLERMESGETMAQAVAEARRAGFAESDPSHDLDGWDAAAKLAILATVLLEGELSPLDVERTGIAALDPEEVRGARRGGKRVKLVCRARRHDSGVRATVSPEHLDGDDPLARHGGAGSVLRIETDLMGPILVHQESPTLRDTAYGVLNDLLDVAGGSWERR